RWQQGRSSRSRSPSADDGRNLRGNKGINRQDSFAHEHDKAREDSLEIEDQSTVLKQAQELYQYVVASQDEKHATEALHGMLGYKLERMTRFTNQYQ
ncbi:unnamed protein product, partial [Amoebophrya sp. A25]